MDWPRIMFIVLLLLIAVWHRFWDRCDRCGMESAVIRRPWKCGCCRFTNEKTIEYQG